MAKLMAIDGNSILHRAYHGVRRLTTRDGTPTNAIFGFLNILLKFLDEENPDALCVVFDRAAPTFRHLAYADYKGTRKAMPEDLAVQIPLLKDVLRAMNIPLYELDGWEADDLLGTIAERDTAAGWETILVSGDKDVLQLISPQTTVKLVSTRMGQTTTQTMTPETFQEKYGFEPIHIVDLKALMGDSSDNLPGVSGIGEKTAMSLIQMYRTIAHLYDHMPDIMIAPNTPAKPGVVQKLSDGKKQAEQCYDLATIRRNAPLDFTPEDACRKPVHETELYELFLRLEFHKMIERFGFSGPGATVAVETPLYTIQNTELVSDPDRAEALLTMWRQEKKNVAILTLPDLGGVCTVWEDGTWNAALFFPERLETYNAFLRGLFAPDITKISHGIKNLMGDLLAENLSTEGFCFDTELAAYLLASTATNYALDQLALSYLNQALPKAGIYQDKNTFASFLTFPEAEKEGKMEKEEFPAPVQTWIQHTVLLQNLYSVFSKRLDEWGLRRVFKEIELPLCPVLAAMERAGVQVDRNALADFGAMLDEYLQKAESSIYELAGSTFNINSTQQLGHILFETLQLPPVKKTKTGYSTNAEVLEKLRGQHPIIDQILQYRQYAKLKSTYVVGLIKVIAPDGRIHTSFQNTVTATGRLSSTEPNLQNIPVRTELGAKLRNMFVAAPGNVLVDADYSQIELRLLAHISGDKTMQEAFQKGADIHTETAAQVFNVPSDQVSGEMRRRAKAVNFGIVYGISDFSLAEDIGVSRAEAKEYIDRYFETFHDVRAYMDRVVEEARKNGYVSTQMGRRRWLPELQSSSHNVRAFGERVALNMPIQGTAADVIKLAMIRVQRAIQEAGLQARLILQVHDELIVECPAHEAETVQQLLTREMEQVVSYTVPLRADAAVGRSWGETKK